jgi:hypothetical protein
MAVGPSEFVVDGWLNYVFNNTAPTAVGGDVWMQLHTADPGAAGTTSVATETTRKQISMGVPAAPSGGNITISNDAQVQWTGIAGSQDASHYSLWTASTSGTFLGSGVITANAYTAGDTLTFAVGDIDITIPCAA